MKAAGIAVVLAALAAQGAIAQAVAPDTSALPPQEIGVVRPGQGRAGLLEAGDFTMSDGTWADIWYVQAVAGQRLAIELRSPRFSPFLQFLDPWGNKLAEEAGSRGSSGARLAFTVREAGRYQIVVNNYSDTPEAGPYTLLVR